MLQVINGDALTELRKLPDRCIQTCVTSPPYWGLRDYGTAKWEGGSDDCKHTVSKDNREYKATGGGCTSWNDRKDNPQFRICKCGAKRIDEQLGLEETPELFISKMVEIFREVRRVLKDDGTLWMNMGDSYFDKSLVGAPWLLAFALKSDGWYLRSDIIWYKPNPMPESVTDRPTKAHEYIFLMSKSERYFYDAEAIREPAIYGRVDLPNAIAKDGRKALSSAMFRHVGDAKEPIQRGNFQAGKTFNPESGRNKRTVWTIATQPYSEAHFATFPEDLVKPCVLAGSKVGDTVLDPFAGSGTSLRVAIELGRQAIGIELNPEYCKLIESRCQTTAGML
jgi:DNA modification methylase